MTNDIKDAERLAALGNSAIRQKEVADLQRLKEYELIKERIKSLNDDVSELFKRFIEKAKAINDNLENEKIIIDYSEIDEDSTTNRKLTFTFNGKSIQVIFADYDTVEKYEKIQRENSIKIQKNHYGMVMNSPDSFFKNENIVLVGIAETNVKIGDAEFGYNLLLKKRDDENGEWFVVSFKKNTAPPKSKFAIELSIFCDEYEKFKNKADFKEEYRKLDDNDISSLLEKILTQQ